MDLLTLHPASATLICAQLFYIRLKRPAILALAKSSGERTETENKLVRHGLLTSILLDMSLFVPASVMITQIVLAPWVLRQLPLAAMSPELTLSVHGLMGIASFGLPLSIAAVIRRVMANAANEFANALHELARFISRGKDDPR
jgi:hypothetical protein